MVGGSGPGRADKGSNLATVSDRRYWLVRTIHRFGDQRWIAAPIAAFASLELVLHHLNWPIVVKMTIVLGLAAASAFLVPHRHLGRVAHAVVPLLLAYWLVAGGSRATSDTPGGMQVAITNFGIQVINLGMQCAAFLVAYSIRTAVHAAVEH